MITQQIQVNDGSSNAVRLKSRYKHKGAGVCGGSSLVTSKIKKNKNKAQVCQPYSARATLFLNKKNGKICFAHSFEALFA